MLQQQPSCGSAAFVFYKGLGNVLQRLRNDANISSASASPDHIVDSSGGEAMLKSCLGQY